MSTELDSDYLAKQMVKTIHELEEIQQELKVLQKANWRNINE